MSKKPDWERAVELVRKVIKEADRMSMTPPVDDDFPEVKHGFDSAVLDYADYLRGKR